MTATKPATAGVKSDVKPATASVPATAKPANATAPATDTKPAPASADSKPTESAPAARTMPADRGDVGVVTIRKSTRDISAVRTRTSTDPIHVSVREAVKGEWYEIEVADDPTKIDRVHRKLRAAAQTAGVGMNIHPDRPAGEKEGTVVVIYRTGDRDTRVKTEDTPATTDEKSADNKN